MNQTNYIILKLLLQQPLREKELLNYLNINLLTLKKAINQLNEKLSNLNLPIIQIANNIYKIGLSRAQREFFYNSCLDYSQEQRCLYLTLKLLITKTLNLENERIDLNISRATIDRDISIIKNNLKNKNMFIISKKWEGLFLDIKDESVYCEYICEILIIFYSEYKFLPGILKEFLMSLQKCKIEDLINKFFNIYDDFNAQIGNISLRYFLALDICFSLPINFHLFKILDCIEKIKSKKSFKYIHETLVNKYNFKSDYALYLAANIYDTIHKKFYFEDLYKPKIDNYCNFFNITLTKENYYLLAFFMYMSGFRYNNNLHEVKNIYLKSEFDKTLLNRLTIFSNENNLKFLYGDLLELLDFTKFFLLDNNRKTHKKILILKKDINIVYFSDLKQKLKQFYPSFTFDVKPYAFIYVLDETNNPYDLILSDVILDLNFKYKLCQVNTVLTTLINEYLIEDMLNS